jgi:hypothetical protein
MLRRPDRGSQVRTQRRLIARVEVLGNGFSWAVAFIIGAVLWPFVSVYLRETTGSFVAAFLLIPVILLVMACDYLVLQP